MLVAGTTSLAYILETGLSAFGAGLNVIVCQGNATIGFAGLAVGTTAVIGRPNLFT
jgi:hypothetical protein